jgi:hypothetical protein
MKLISLITFLMCEIVFSILLVLFVLVGVDNLSNLQLHLPRIMHFTVAFSMITTLLSAVMFNHFNFNKE